MKINIIKTPHVTELCLDSEVVDKPTEEHQKVYSVYITDSIAKFPKMTRLYTFKHREVQEDTTDLSAVALRENMAYNICPSETGRNPSLCSEVTDGATKDHQEMPIYEVIAENMSNIQDTSWVSTHWAGMTKRFSGSYCLKEIQHILLYLVFTCELGG